MTGPKPLLEQTAEGAGAVVTSDVPEGIVAYGHPPRPGGLTTNLEPIAAKVPFDHPLLGGSR